jgi:hypothetical protein
VPLSGAFVQAGRHGHGKGKNSYWTREPAAWLRRPTPRRREDFMTDNDATVLAKFVFVVFGLGLTGMVAQLIMLG